MDVWEILVGYFNSVVCFLFFDLVFSLLFNSLLVVL